MSLHLLHSQNLSTIGVSTPEFEREGSNGTVSTADSCGQPR